ncbi:YceI family protein [Taibaiella lutea]|uniref:YceI family protein n=1 Tax=Taibaiella lutea TaxID=2608001 RepID=A0A5M6CGX7_9BACT|nr:YceI family protein [Taibaiella lutea]KAA5532369.1 YceI family protein [Taibaiella lutea]
MKLHFSILSLIFINILFFSFKKDNTYKIDLTKSGMTWRMPITGGEHNGTIKINSGYLVYDGNAIKAGTFTIDLNTVKDLDLEKEKQPKIEAHIKSEDFFETAKYPYATFVIDKIEKKEDNELMAYGKLTIKNITKPISFPVKFKESNNVLYVTADKIKINRKQYGIEIKNKGFKGGLKEMVINDAFNVSFSIALHP